MSSVTYGAQGSEVMYFWCFQFRGVLGFMNCDDICMCVVNKQFELLEFVFDSVLMYVDLWCITAFTQVCRKRRLNGGFRM